MANFTVRVTRVERIIFIAACALAAAIGSGRVARAVDPPPLVPVQGFLADAAGNPVGGAHGLRFTLYPSETSVTPLYTETDANVTVTAGNFVVYLGAVQPLDLALFRGTAQLWLEIVVDGTEIIQPRVQLATAPYAGSARSCGDAATLGGNAASAFAQASHNHAFSSITGVPAGLAQLGALACGDGQIPKESGGVWMCGADSDTDTLAGLACTAGQVVQRGAGAWGCATLAPVATSGAFGDLSGVPAGLLTGSAEVGFLPRFTANTTLGQSSVFQGKGGVGIGTTAPAAPLHVAGNVRWGSANVLDAAGTIDLGDSGGSGTVPDINLHFGIAGSQAFNVRIGNPADGELRLEGNTLRFMETTSTAPNVILGWSGNAITAGVVGATISGGGGSDVGFTTASPNIVTDDFGTIGGGLNNIVGDGRSSGTSAPFATVGGGRLNTASGDTSTIGGGLKNTASGSTTTIAGGTNNIVSSNYATIGGGANHSVSGDFATVAGGVDNSASGSFATVPGGHLNVAAGSMSFAAGNRAKANQAGCFAWGDSTNADVACDTPNAWVARASGGVTFFTNGSLTTGVSVAAGGGSWASASDRDAKRDVVPVDPGAVLAALDRVPVATWRYKSEASGAKHMGPMAQDFRAAFGLGDSDKTITSVDADGVALAAIAGVRAIEKEQAARIAELGRENAELRARLDGVERRLGSGPLLGGAGTFGGGGLGLGFAGGLVALGLVAARRRRGTGW